MTEIPAPHPPTRDRDPEPDRAPTSVLDEVRARADRAVRQVSHRSHPAFDGVRSRLDGLGTHLRAGLERARREAHARGSRLRDASRDRLGDVRGRVQPVVEQAHARARHAVAIGRDRARSLVGRSPARSGGTDQGERAA